VLERWLWVGPLVGQVNAKITSLQDKKVAFVTHMIQFPRTTITPNSRLSDALISSVVSSNVKFIKTSNPVKRPVTIRPPLSDTDIRFPKNFFRSGGFAAIAATRRDAY
jgi:hypothetical protein